MALSATFANELAKLIFHGTAIANLAANGSSPAQQYWISLHTADPSTTGNQSTHEVAYTGYARIALQRTDKSWSVEGRIVKPLAEIPFADVPEKAKATVASHFGIGLSTTGTGRLLIVGGLAPLISISELTRPVLLPRTEIRFN